MIATANWSLNDRMRKTWLPNGVVDVYNNKTNSADRHSRRPELSNSFALVKTSASLRIYAG